MGEMCHKVVIIDAPSTLGLRAKGVEQLPQRLLQLGLQQRLYARRVVHVEPPRPDGLIDAATGILNAPQIVAWSPKLADAVGGVIDEGMFPVVLGGDCTIVLGSMLALRRIGRYGLFFIDGNADFFQPGTAEGEGASMDLALVTGHGPSAITDLDGRGPLVSERDTVLFGFRDHEDQLRGGSQPLPDGMRALDIHEVKRLGAEEAARLAVRYLEQRGVSGFFIHVDADVLDDTAMPAVDFRIPYGLTPAELGQVLRVALASRLAVGLELTIYNPTLDGDGNAGRLLVSIISDAFAAESGG